MQLDLRATPDQPGRKGLRVPPVRKVMLGLRVLLVLRALQARKGRKALRGRRVFRVRKVLPVQRVTRVRQVRRARLGSRRRSTTTKSRRLSRAATPAIRICSITTLRKRQQHKSMSATLTRTGLT